MCHDNLSLNLKSQILRLVKGVEKVTGKISLRKRFGRVANVSDSDHVLHEDHLMPMKTTWRLPVFLIATIAEVIMIECMTALNYV